MEDIGYYYQLGEEFLLGEGTEAEVIRDEMKRSTPVGAITHIERRQLGFADDMLSLQVNRPYPGQKPGEPLRISNSAQLTFSLVHLHTFTQPFLSFFRTLLKLFCTCLTWRRLFLSTAAGCAVASSYTASVSERSTPVRKLFHIVQQRRATHTHTIASISN